MAEAEVFRVVVQHFHTRGVTTEIIHNAVTGTMVSIDSSKQEPDVFRSMLRGVTKEVAMEYMAVVNTFTVYEEGKLVYIEQGELPG